MSLDRTLKSRTALVRHRNVLTRAERVEKLADLERWKEGTSVFGLPKVAHRKVVTGHKAAKKEEKPAATVEGEAAPPVAEADAKKPAEKKPAEKKPAEKKG
jgi:small basic protein (TIGR04137 family)